MESAINPVGGQFRSQAQPGPEEPWGWGVALFEYALQVPANRLGYGRFSLGQLKIMQEMITLTVFVPFSIVYMKEAPKLDYLWAALCIGGAAYFIFRSR
jgi:hypothetical protein